MLRYLRCGVFRLPLPLHLHKYVACATVRNAALPSASRLEKYRSILLSLCQILCCSHPSLTLCVRCFVLLILLSSAGAVALLRQLLCVQARWRALKCFYFARTLTHNSVLFFAVSGATASWRGTPPTCNPLRCLAQTIGTNVTPCPVANVGGTCQVRCAGSSPWKRVCPRLCSHVFHTASRHWCGG